MRIKITEEQYALLNGNISQKMLIYPKKRLEDTENP